MLRRTLPPDEGLYIQNNHRKSQVIREQIVFEAQIEEDEFWADNCPDDCLICPHSTNCLDINDKILEQCIANCEECKYRKLCLLTQSTLLTI